MIKRIHLTIIAIFLLLFSGCDAVLNGIYPEYDTSSYGNDKFNIDVNLNVDQIKVNYDTNIKVALVPITNDGMHIVDINNIWFYDFWNTSYINFAFDYLDKQKYMVFAFIDRDGNNRPGFDEPSITLKHYTNYGEEETFDFSYSEGEIILKAEGTIRDYVGIDGYWLDEFNKGVVNNDYIDLTFSVDGIDDNNGDDIYRYENANPAVYYINPNDSNIFINYFDWSVSDDNWNPITYKGSTNEETVYIYNYYDNFLSIDIGQLDIPENVNGIYIKVHVKYTDGHDAWFDRYVNISNVPIY